MVPGAGIEPARCCHRGIFLPTTTFAAALTSARLWPGLSLYHITTELHDTGRSRQVSTLSLSRQVCMKLHKYSEKQLIEAVENSTSMRQVLQKLGVAPYGGNYDVLKKAIKFYKPGTSHFSGQAWNKGKNLPPRQPINKYLKNEVPIQSYKLKNRLLKEGLFKRECSNCTQTRWLDQPIPLELDHINGNNKDNRLQNLRLLCPNCHALTPTYRSKNRLRA